MPRRPVKNPRKQGFQPGVSGNPSGKPRGTKHSVVISEKVREAFAQLLDNNIDQLESWLHALAKKSPEKALDIWVRISERFVPMLSRTEITGKDGESFQPITINLPNIPKIDLSVGESSPQALPSTPEEEPKQLGEGTPTFQLPKFELSPNVLRDIQEIGEATPTDLSQTPGTGPGDFIQPETEG